MASGRGHQVFSLERPSAWRTSLPALLGPELPNYGIFHKSSWFGVELKQIHIKWRKGWIPVNIEPYHNKFLAHDIQQIDSIIKAWKSNMCVPETRTVSLSRPCPRARDCVQKVHGSPGQCSSCLGEAPRFIPALPKTNKNFTYYKLMNGQREKTLTTLECVVFIRKNK